jgi:hypothetical protein
MLQSILHFFFITPTANFTSASSPGSKALRPGKGSRVKSAVGALINIGTNMRWCGMYFFMLCLLSSANTLTAQDDQSEPEHRIPRFTIKTNPLMVINPFKQAATLTSDLRLGPDLSVDLGLGWFTGSSNFAQFQGESYTGPRLRLGAKYFVTSGESGLYIGPEFKYQQVKNEHFQSVLRQGDQYTQRMLIQRDITSYGALFRLGVHSYFDKRKHWLIDIYMGGGVISHQVKRTGIPSDGTIFADDDLGLDFEMNAGKSQFPDVIAGFTVGYAVW